VAKDTLKNGLGYWLKFSGDHNVSIPGIPRSSDSVDVSSGWNMIGSVSSLLSITNVVPSSGVNIVSPFYQYQNGYATTTTLYPGKAYWVKVSASGKLYLGAPGH
jgi:hypothetical protein